MSIIDGNHIKTQCREGGIPVPLQPTLGRPNYASLFSSIDGIGGCAETGPPPRSNFYKHQCGAIAHNQIQFSDAITGVTTKQHQALTDQVGQRMILRLAPTLLR